MWENLNGEWIWMDKEMGADEYERSMAGGIYDRSVVEHYSSAGRPVGPGGIAVGVAGGMIAAKALPRFMSWLFWMVVLFVVVCVL